MRDFLAEDIIAEPHSEKSHPSIVRLASKWEERAVAYLKASVILSKVLTKPAVSSFCVNATTAPNA